MKVVFATQNRGKLREAGEILGDGVEILTPQDCGIGGEAEETGDSFAENSLLKARYVAERLFGAVSGQESSSAGIPSGKPSGEDVCAVFADDSGLETDALGGEPGIYTARYAGADKNFADNMDKLLSRLQEAGAMAPEDRGARFRCIVTLILRGGEVYSFDGTLEGRIALAKAGCGGFGYDPVFIPSDAELEKLSSFGLSAEETGALRGKTIAEIPEHLKNLISHRFKALQPVPEMLSLKMAASGRR